MIRHQAVGSDSHRVLVESLGDDFLERLEVVVLAEKRLSAHAATRDVKHRSAGSDTGCPRLDASPFFRRAANNGPVPFAVPGGSSSSDSRPPPTLQAGRNPAGNSKKMKLRCAESRRNG